MESKLKIIDHIVKIITTLVISIGISKLSNLETGISTLNQQMATIIERTVNQDKDINDNRSRIERLEDFNLMLTKEGRHGR